MLRQLGKKLIVVSRRERDIAEGKVVPHEEVMRQAWELLKKYGC